MTDLSGLRANFLELVELHAVSGAEQDVRTRILEALEECDCEVTVDVMGNVIARRDIGAETTILLVAHMDEVGMMVTRIEDSGFLRFRPVGYPVEILMPGNVVKVGPVFGVIGSRDFHTTPDHLRSQLPSVEELFIDVGARSGDEARSWGVEVGTFVSYRHGVTRLGASGEVIGSKSVDNRVACAIGIEILRRAPAARPANVIVLFAVQEEVGLRGTTMAMDSIRPDCAIALDNALTEDTPFYPPPTVETVRVGGGPLLALREEIRQAMLGMIPHPGMIDWVRRTARAAGIPLQQGFLAPFGATDGTAVHVRHGGIPTVYIGVPSRYAHSPVELVDLRDLDATCELVAALVDDAAAKQWLT